MVGAFSCPFSLLKALAFFSDEVSFVQYKISCFIKLVVSSICLFLGNLVVKAFSRKREFEADALAAALIDKESMVEALNSLSRSPVSFPKEQGDYAAFKINGTPAWLDIFSTHPSIERRIARLEKLSQ